MTQKTAPSAMYNAAKTITVLLVVLAHCARMYTGNGAFTPVVTSPVWAKISEYIYIFHMPFFIFISGAVYGLCIQNGKYQKPLPFLLNKAKRLLVPYFAFGLLFLAPVMWYIGLAEDGFLNYCCKGILLSLDPRHLWFLEALFFIFLFCVFLRKWLLKSHLHRFLVLGAAGVIYLAASYLPPHFQLQGACSYLLFFITGVMFHIYYQPVVAVLTKFKYLWGLLPVVLAGWFFLPNNLITIPCFKILGILMMLAVSLLAAESSRLVNAKWFQCLKDTSMGVYLFHPLIIYLAFYWLKEKSLSPTLLCLTITVISTLLSILFTKLIRIVRFTFLLGE